MNEQNGQKDRKMVERKEHKGRKYKPRSPRYPCISLREAVKNAKALYEKDGKALVAKEVAVKVWGYNKLHGRSLTILAAMAQYGLLRYQSGSVGISDDAFTIIEAPRNSSERKASLERCAKSPTIFDELFQSYSDNLPSDEALKWTLKQRGFTDEGAQTTIGCLRDTNMFVKEELKDYTGGNEVKEEIEERKELPPKQSMVQQIIKPIGATLPQGSYTATDSFTLDEGPVVLQYPTVLSKSSFEDFDAWLKLQLGKIKRRIKDNGTTDKKDELKE
jgi:hypothetical protein